MLLVVTPACGQQEERSLCDSYEQFRDAQGAIRAIDPTAESAAGATNAVEEYIGAARGLRQTADDRHRLAIDELLARSLDVLVTLESVDPDAGYSTWAPLVREDLEDARAAAEHVEELVGPQCPPVTEN